MATAEERRRLHDRLERRPVHIACIEAATSTTEAAAATTGRTAA